ncbi:hypothetical protein RHS01_09889 [Rhizoctonia solani]|uniref:Uncharacterized protein n=1 Tax=Rhizoctonia solani TaxID=456999 RepID=A0A8H7I4F7_9AGAM|nr:hypothetical protein RHS01_09889 [Rhizoctonia solani]
MMVIGLWVDNAFNTVPTTFAANVNTKIDKSFYFPHGDVLVKMNLPGWPIINLLSWRTANSQSSSTTNSYQLVEFKLHRDIISRNSAYLRKIVDSLSSPNGNVSHSSEAKVSAKFMRHQAIFEISAGLCIPIQHRWGIPPIEAGDVGNWRSTVEAAEEFGMPTIQAYIVTRLMQDEAKIVENAALFLKWTMRLKELDGSQDRIRKCYWAFAFRRLPPSPNEIKDIPGYVAYNIMLIRERVRTVLINRQVSKLSLRPSLSCAESCKCESTLIDQVVQNMLNTSSDPDQPSSVLESLYIGDLCGLCSAPALLNLLKQKLSLEITQYIEQLGGMDSFFPPCPS